MEFSKCSYADGVQDNKKVPLLNTGKKHLLWVRLKLWHCVMAAVLTWRSISRMTVTLSLLCPSALVMMTMMEELRVPVKGVQQGEELYRFIIPKAKHEPFIVFLCGEVQWRTLFDWTTCTRLLACVCMYVSNVSKHVRKCVHMYNVPSWYSCLTT
jgi:hypothetical protein